MIKDMIQKIVNRENLSEKDMIEVMTEIMSGQATESQIASFITALRMKGETVEEITGAAKVMKQFATRVEIKKRVLTNVNYETILDTCGTGGDSTKTFNISTATAFVVSSCDVLVAKHGNRSVSSLCGSADVVEQLGIKLEITKDKAEKCLSELGIVFLFAPIWHSAMKYALGPRKQIGIRTIFNIIGPLTNPAGANAQVLGVYSKTLLKPIAEVLKNLGSKHSFVVHSEDMMDEISITGKTHIAELKNGSISFYDIVPEQFGIKKCSIDDLKGADAKENAEIILRIVSGKENGPKMDVVILNSAFALVAAGKVKSIEEGIVLARDVINRGLVIEKINMLKEYTNE